MARKKIKTDDRAVSRIDEPVVGRGVRLRLKGPMAGSTVQLAGVRFTRGEAEVPTNHEGLVKYLGLCYQAAEVRDEDATVEDGEPGPVQELEGDPGRDAGEAGQAGNLGVDDDPEEGQEERGPDGD